MLYRHFCDLCTVQMRHQTDEAMVFAIEIKFFCGIFCEDFQCAALVGDVKLRGFFDDEIGNFGRNRPYAGVFSFLPFANNKVIISVFQKLYHCRDVSWVILQIAIQRYHIIAGSIIETGHHCRALPIIFFQLNQNNIRIIFFFDFFHCSVRRSIIDQNQLVSETGHRIPDFVDQKSCVSFFVKHRDYQRIKFILIHRIVLNCYICIANFCKNTKNSAFPMSQNQLLTTRQILFLYAGFLAVYISGLFVPLMENDSAQHATMAMRMALNNDFLNIYKWQEPYLDKPHMHFWLAAMSMKLFGINHVAYRIPALLCIFLGAFSTKKLTDLLYENQNFGYLSSLIFLSAQTIILSAHDVRTDAVLTGFIIFSVWQLVRFIKKQSLVSIVLGGLGAAFAFSSKGQMAIVIIGFCIFSYLLYSREWKRFFNWKLFLGLLSFILGIAPVLFAYYHQFGEEGLRFILFNQSFNRLTASGFEETSPDYLFFFHTLLWVFLPFSLAFYVGVFDRSYFFIKNKFRKTEGNEFLTLGGFWLVMLLFSASKFKLPHYLNGLIAVLSIFTAAYLFKIFRENQKMKIKVLWIIQLVVIAGSMIVVGLLSYYFTGINNVWMFGLCGILFLFLIYQVLRKENIFRKYVVASLLLMISVNIFLNTQFYPVLINNYESGISLADYVRKNKIDEEKIVMLPGADAWSFDFYLQKNIPRVSPDDLKKDDYVVVHESFMNQLSRQYRVVVAWDYYPVTRLSLKFLNPKTRNAQLETYYLIQIL